MAPDHERTEEAGEAWHEDAIAPGTRLGRYEIQGLLGAGGMGAVFEARDPDLDRAVAIKVLRSRGGALERGAARLRREGVTMARLAHPNVIRVYDVGVANGSVFVAMELVRGGTLAEWLARGPRTPDEVIAKFVQAGRGLAAAHDAGLVHRDFKPHNVLVGDDGRVLVTDFGLARAVTDDDRAGGDAATAATAPVADTVTRAGEIVGTPAYMAPEQRRGEPIDARADQYSFCLALWRALVGPVAAEGSSEPTARPGEQRLPPRPTARAVPARLRAALQRGMRAEPVERFRSMHELLARLDPARSRVRPWLAAAAVGAVIAGVAVWALRAPAEAADPCVEASAIAEWDDAARGAIRASFRATGRPYADQTYATVASRLDDYTRRWRDVRVSSCRATRAQTQSIALGDARTLCLDRRRDAVGALVGELAHADGEVVDHAVEAVGQLDDLAVCDAEPSAHGEPLPSDPERARRIRALEHDLARAEARLDTGRAGDDADAITSTVVQARAAGYKPLAVQAALVAMKLAGVRARWQDFAAEAEAGVLAAEVAGDDDARLRFLTKLVETLGFRLQRPADADVRARAAEAVLARLGDSPARAAAYLCAIAKNDWWKGDWDEGLDEAERCVAQAERVRPADPALVARALHMEAILDDELGHVEDGLALERRALELSTQTLGAGHPQVAVHLITIGGFLRRKHQYQDAEAAFLESIRVLTAAQGETTDVASAFLDVGLVYSDLERYDDAAASFRRALAIYEARGVPDHEYLAQTLDKLGLALARGGHPEEGEAAALRSLAIRAQAGLGDHPGTAEAHRMLGKQYRLRKRYPEALARYQESLRILEQRYGKQSPQLVSTLTGFGDIYLDMGRAADARAVLERALPLTESPDASGKRAQVELGLAKAWWSTPTARPRAVAYAADARRRFEAANDDQGLRDLERWLASTGQK